MNLRMVLSDAQNAQASHRTRGTEVELGPACEEVMYISGKHEQKWQV